MGLRDRNLVPLYEYLLEDYRIFLIIPNKYIFSGYLLEEKSLYKAVGGITYGKKS